MGIGAPLIFGADLTKHPGRFHRVNRPRPERRDCVPRRVISRTGAPPRTAYPAGGRNSPGVTPWPEDRLRQSKITIPEKIAQPVPGVHPLLERRERD
jgi:hypothetical protein